MLLSRGVRQAEALDVASDAAVLLGPRAERDRQCV